MIWLWITVTALALITALGILVKTRHPRLGWTIVGLAMAAALVFAVSAAVLWSAPDSSPELEADYALLLGCSLRNGQATPELVRRCQTALDWLEAHPHGLLVVSGGDPGHQGVTEAAVMAAWLRNPGANAKQILLEDQASDTRENLLFSKTLVEGQARTQHRPHHDMLVAGIHQLRTQRRRHRLGRVAQRPAQFVGHGIANALHVVAEHTAATLHPHIAQFGHIVIDNGGLRPQIDYLHSVVGFKETNKDCAARHRAGRHLQNYKKPPHRHTAAPACC